MRLSETHLRNLIRQTVKRALVEAESDEKADPAATGALEKLSIKSGPSSAVQFLNGPGADPRVRALLSAGDIDGDETDEAATISEGSGTCGELIPTQVEIELTKSIGYPLAKFDLMKKMISGGVQRIGPAGNDMIVKSGNLIVDGHHRWSSLFSVAGASGQIAAIDVALPEKDAASVLAIVQTAIAATLDGPVPKAKAGGMNILGESKDSIVAMIRKSYESGSGEAGPILTDDYVLACLQDNGVAKHFGLTEVQKSFGMEGAAEAEARSAKKEGVLREKRNPVNRKALAKAREIIINKVADNLSQMKKPAAGSPPRVDMPQLDKAGGGVQGALEKLKSGEVNYKAPYAAENRTRSNDQVVLERWQKLAGLIKG